MFDGGINSFDAFTRLPEQNAYVAQLLRPVASSLLPGGDMLTIRIGGWSASSHRFGDTLERLGQTAVIAHCSQVQAIWHHAVTPPLAPDAQV